MTCLTSYSHNNNISFLAKCWNCTEHSRKPIRIKYGIRSSQKPSYSCFTIKVNIYINNKQKKMSLLQLLPKITFTTEQNKLYCVWHTLGSDKNDTFYHTKRDEIGTCAKDVNALLIFVVRKTKINLDYFIWVFVIVPIVP